MGIYIKKNLFLIVVIEDADASLSLKLSEALERQNMAKVTLERVIYGFLERLISEDLAFLEKIESEISEHEDHINENKVDKSFNNDITRIRKKLLLLHNYFEQLITFGEELQENGNDLFEEDNLRYFKIFTDRVTRLSENTKMLREYIAQVKEAYQYQLDYNLNNIMKLFTVVTTIFLPLTLIVGWYGMNFEHMPELSWKWGYPSVFLGSILVVIVCIVFFKKKKFL
jgi:magnesium transporter